MRRTVAATFLLLNLVLLCSAIAGAAEPTVFIFDASSSRLSASGRPIRAGTPIEVLIVHPNNFRESYQVKVETIDFHETSLPDILKGVVWIGTTRLDTLPTQISRAAVVSTLYADSSTAHTGGILPPSLRLAYDKAIARVAAIDLEAKVRFQHVMRMPLAAPLATQLTLAQDNADARAQAILAVDAVHSDWWTTQEDDSGAVAQDSGAYHAKGILSMFETTTRRWSNDWDEALYDWDRAYVVYSQGKPVSARIDSVAKAADADVQMCKKWMEALQGKVDKVRPDVESFVELASVALDTLRTPDVIRRETVASGDEVTATIVIHRFSFVEEKQKSLPALPQSTISHKVPVYGRWTLDISAGFLATGLRQQNFITVPSQDSSSTSKVVKEGSHDEADIAPGLFAHYMWTTRSGNLFWALGPTLGISTSSPIRYFAGGSVQLGRSARLSLSAGIAWGKLKVLNGEQENAQLINTPLSVAEVIRRDWGVGLSFAISPRLPGKKS